MSGLKNFFAYIKVLHSNIKSHTDKMLGVKKNDKN